MNIMIGAMINIKVMEYIDKQIEKLREELQFARLTQMICAKEILNLQYKRASCIKAWDEEDEKDCKDWFYAPTSNNIFNRRVIDNGDRFHHYDRDGYKRNRRIGKFDNNYANAVTQSKRQANLDRIAQWAILDGVKQDVIDNFIIKYNLSAIEIARFENVMTTTHNDKIIHLKNLYDNSWYIAHHQRFNSNVPFEIP